MREDCSEAAPQEQWKMVRKNFGRSGAVGLWTEEETYCVRKGQNAAYF